MNPQQPNGQQLPPNQQAPNGPYYGPPGVPTQPYPSPQPIQSNLPQQQYGAPTVGSAPTQQYDFIMNPGVAAPRRSVGSDNKMVRIAIVGVLLVIVLIGVSVLMSILHKPKFSTTELITVAQEQNELVRVANVGMINGHSQTTLDSALTVKLSVASAQQQLVAYLTKEHIKVNPATLALKQSTLTDQQLKSALTASTFDATFMSIIQTQLTAYQKSLKQAYDANPGPNGRALLQQEYTSAGLLLKQSQQH